MNSRTGQLRLLFRWKVLKSVLELLEEVGDAYEDGKLAKEEKKRVMKAMWNVVRVYHGRP